MTFDRVLTVRSVASLDIGFVHTFDQAPPEVWTHELAECIEQIIERSRNKRNTAEAREEQLAIYSSILKAQYAADEVQPKLDELLPALLKCFRSGSGEREAVFALKALALTIITTGEEIFHEVQQPLKVRIQDASSDMAQATAILALGTATFLGGADVTETEDIMDYLLEIIESDGESVGAADSGPVVTAALQEWGLLATQYPSMEGRSEHPISVFEDQLDSSILSVQVAAGDNIALLYEKSYTRRDEDEEDSEEDVSADDDDDAVEEDDFEYEPFRRTQWAQRYDVYSEDEFSLKSKLAELSRATGRHLAKDKKKDLHKTFRDILHTIEHPWRGPRFSTALDKKALHFMGHRLFLMDGRNTVITIDRWWKFHRYEAMRRALGQGFVTHYRLNRAVKDVLPACLEAPVRF
jgi:Interferon-related developmental regulator (IFRD)